MTRLSILASAATALALGAAPIAAFAKPADDAFLKKAVMGDTGEIAMGHMIEQKGATPAVRTFGAMLVRDHTPSRAKAEALAKSMGVDTPETLEPDAQQSADQLSKLSGATFDRQMRAAAIEDHKKDIAAYEAEAKKGAPKTAAFARMTLPTLRKHLAAAEALPK